MLPRMPYGRVCKLSNGRGLEWGTQSRRRADLPGRAVPCAGVGWEMFLAEGRFHSNTR